jgi:hypothetical protein
MNITNYLEQFGYLASAEADIKSDSLLLRFQEFL